MTMFAFTQHSYNCVQQPNIDEYVERQDADICMLDLSWGLADWF